MISLAKLLIGRLRGIGGLAVKGDNRDVAGCQKLPEIFEQGITPARVADDHGFVERQSRYLGRIIVADGTRKISSLRLICQYRVEGRGIDDDHPGKPRAL